MHPLMTPRCLEILGLLLKAEEAELWEDAEIVEDRGQCWIGLERTSIGVVNRLLQLALLHHTNDGGCDRYTLNEEGRAMARDPEYQPLISESFGLLRWRN